MKRYLTFYIVFLCLLGTFFAFGYYFLLKAHELTDMREIVKKQQEDNGIYLSALRTEFYAYKLKGYELRKPDIAVIGSSRTLQIREGSFNTSFYNLGLAVRSIDNANMMFDDMLKIHKPKFIILSLDAWWFNPNSRVANFDPKPTEYGTTFSANQLLMPYRWMIEGKISIDKAKDIVFGNVQDYGIQGITKRDGMIADGSCVYNHQLFSGKPFDDAKFALSIRSIERSDMRFEHADEYDESQLQKLELLVEKLKSNGVDFVMIFPPYAPQIADMIQNSGHYKYIDKLRDRLKTDYPDVFFDFFDGRALGSGDCEFNDGFHGGEVTYLRILSAIHEKRPMKYLNIDKVNDLIARYSGNASTSSTKEKPELDFLELGCKKLVNQ